MNFHCIQKVQLIGVANALNNQERSCHLAIKFLVGVVCLIVLQGVTLDLPHQSQQGDINYLPASSAGPESS